MSSLIDNLKIEDLNEEQQQLAELIGIENYCKLVQTFGGLSVYIPRIESFERMLRDESLREEFNGYNIRELSRKYGLTEVRVRSIVADIYQKQKRQPIEGQITLF